MLKCPLKWPRAPLTLLAGLLLTGSLTARAQVIPDHHYRLDLSTEMEAGEGTVRVRATFEDVRLNVVSSSGATDQVEGQATLQPGKYLQTLSGEGGVHCTFLTDPVTLHITGTVAADAQGHMLQPMLQVRPVLTPAGLAGETCLVHGQTVPALPYAGLFAAALVRDPADGAAHFDHWSKKAPLLMSTDGAQSSGVEGLQASTSLSLVRYDNVEVQVAAFVPSPMFGRTLQALPEGQRKVFGGHNRTSLYAQSTPSGSLVWMTVEVNADPALPSPVVKSAQVQVSTLQAFDASAAKNVAGRPWWWLEPQTGASRTPQTVQPGIMPEASLQVLASPTGALEVQGHLTFPLPLPPVLSSTQSQWKVWVEQARGQLARSRVEGSHLTFPAFELYLNGKVDQQAVYAFTPEDWQRENNEPTAFSTRPVQLSWVAVPLVQPPRP